MKILKHGQLKSQLMRFRCSVCGCEFEMEFGEQLVRPNSQMDIVSGSPRFYTDYPECKKKYG